MITLPWWLITLILLVFAYVIFIVRMIHNDVHGIGKAIVLIVGVIGALFVSLCGIAYYIGTLSAG